MIHDSNNHPMGLVWNGMVQRCTNPKRMNFKGYGGRGISVCARWREFDNFVEDMHPRPDGHQIHRVDHDGDYEPGNCIWIDASEHSRLHSSGEGNVSAKLNSFQVRVIRAGVARGHLLRHFAEAFGVSVATISRVARRETWQHL